LRLSSSSGHIDYERVGNEIAIAGVVLVIPLIQFFREFVGLIGALSVVALTESLLFVFVSIYKHYAGKPPLKWLLSVTKSGTFFVLEMVNRLKDYIGLESAVIAVTLSLTAAIYIFWYFKFYKKHNIVCGTYRKSRPSRQKITKCRKISNATRRSRAR
jgi:O-antigen/teichoic acid export membrane protein